MPLAKHFPSTDRMSQLLQFQHFMYYHMKQSSQKQQFWSAWPLLGEKLHQKYKPVGSKRVKASCHSQGKRLTSKCLMLEPKTLFCQGRILNLHVQGGNRTLEVECYNLKSQLSSSLYMVSKLHKQGATEPCKWSATIMKVNCLPACTRSLTCLSKEQENLVGGVLQS